MKRKLEILRWHFVVRLCSNGIWTCTDCRRNWVEQ